MKTPDEFLMMRYTLEEESEEFLPDLSYRVLSATRVFSTYEPLHTQYDCQLLNGSVVRMYNDWNCFWLPFDHMGQVVHIPEFIVHD